MEYLQQLITEMVSDLHGDIEVGEEFTFTYHDLEFSGRVYERFNGHLVVVLICTAGFGKGNKDLASFKALALS